MTVTRLRVVHPLHTHELDSTAVTMSVLVQWHTSAERLPNLQRGRLAFVWREYIQRERVSQVLYLKNVSRIYIS